jgi:hypothetical protein
VLKIDIKGYFMHINREMLLARCREILAKAIERRGEGVLGGASDDGLRYYPDALEWLLFRLR